MNSTLRIAFVGAGANTRSKHIPGFHAIAGVHLHGVVNRTEASSLAVKEAFGLRRIYPDWQALVADPEVDAVCIGTWPYLHCPVTVAALQAGKHVLCEARMAMNLQEARAMAAAAESAPGCVAQLVPAPFFLDKDAFVRDLLGSGILGEILSVEMRSYSRGFVTPEAPMTWRQDVNLSGLNTMGMGILYEMVMRWVGDARTVCAHTKTHISERSDATGGRREIGVPDHVEVVGELASGASYHLVCSAVTGGGPENAVWVFGSKGTLHVDLATKQIYQLLAGETVPRELSPAPAPGWRVEEEFVGAIRGLEPVRYTHFADGLRYMAFTEAVSLSHRTGQRITLPFPDTGGI